MHLHLSRILSTLLLAFGLAVCTAAEPPIDPIRGRALMEKSKRGETLSVEDQAYLERVKAAIRERTTNARPNSPPPASAQPPPPPPRPPPPQANTGLRGGRWGQPRKSRRRKAGGRPAAGGPRPITPRPTSAPGGCGRGTT